MKEMAFYELLYAGLAGFGAAEMEVSAFIGRQWGQERM